MKYLEKLCIKRW